MYDLPFQQTPCNFPQEERLMRRLYRLLMALDVVANATWKIQPRLSRDLEGLGELLGGLACTLECQLYHPGRLRTWLERETHAKRPPARMSLVLKLLASARKATKDVLRIHNHTAREEDSVNERCPCCLCADVLNLRWLLGKARRLLFSVSERKVSL
jgi:hypothetical protein